MHEPPVEPFSSAYNCAADSRITPSADLVVSEARDLTLGLPELSPLELALRFTNERRYFVAKDLGQLPPEGTRHITSPAYGVIEAADEFKDKTTAINQLRKTNLAYSSVIRPAILALTHF